MNYLFPFTNWNNENRKRRVCVSLWRRSMKEKNWQNRKSRGKTFRKEISQQGITKITNKNKQRIKLEQLLKGEMVISETSNYKYRIYYTIPFSVAVCSFIQKFQDRIWKTGDAGKAKLSVSSGTPFSWWDHFPMWRKGSEIAREWIF